MPAPVSATVSATKSPRSFSGVSSPPSVTLAADTMIVAAVGHGVARVDHQVDQRQFEFGDVDRDRPHVGGDVDLQVDIAARRARQHFVERRDGLAGDRRYAG